jgi:hypothetical protein
LLRQRLAEIVSVSGNVGTEPADTPENKRDGE